MKQIWSNYSYSPTTNVLTLTGLNIDRDQLLLVAAPERGRIMYNFADSSVTASAFTSGANTALTLVATTAGLTTTAALVIYYDDQLQSTSVSISNFPATQPVSIASVTIGNTVTIAGTVTANPTGTQTIAGTVTVGALPALTTNTDFSIVGEGIAQGINAYGTIPIAADWQNASQGIGYLSVIATCVTSTNRIGVVTIGGGTVTIGAGISQIGSVTASISGTVPISISSVTIGNSVTIASLPAISGTVTANVDAGSLTTALNDFTDSYNTAFPVGIDMTGFGNGTVPISGTVTANTFALQGTAVTTSNFTSTTASTVLANYNATREVLTIFNEGAGNLHICAGATCTTIAYQVRLSAGDYYEVPNHQTTITHSAVFATAGTARVTEVS